MLLSMAGGGSRPPWDDIPVRDERLLTVGQRLVREPNKAIFSSAEPSSETRTSGERGLREARQGRHAATPPPYLERRGARFVVFSAIGGFVFLLGLGLQAVLTGRWQVLPVVSYLIQAVVSVETSFLLNRWLTWRDRDTPFWLAFARFNAQKTVTIALNLALYAVLLRLGMNYLVANVVLTAVFTVVNYVAGDRLVFIPGRTRRVEPVTPVAPTLARERWCPQVSVVIPCRDNEHTIGPAVLSLLDQDYPGLREIVLIGSPGDSTWRGLAGISHPRLTIWELETPQGVRDANFKRDAAIRMTTGDLIALVDSDIALPRDWMSRAIAALQESDSSCVAGGMRSLHENFWGRYTDSTWIGAKTPRIAESYTVTSADFGAHGRKPPISANVVFTRELYDHCPIDPMWSHGSYEDYEWFWRVTKAGYSIRVCRDLFGWHHHRRGLRALAREYRRSSRGCAYFIRAHRDSPLAKRRLRQAIILPLVAITAAVGMVAAAAEGYATAVAGLVLGIAAVLAVHQVVRTRNLESVAYPAVGLALGLVFTAGLVTNLVRPGSYPAVKPATEAIAPELGPPPPRFRERRPWRYLLHPLTAICAAQAALSLSLVWSNTIYGDEADYLDIGHLLLAHLLHGSWWPARYAHVKLSGSPYIYPPIGAAADNFGNLADARILSMAFMLGATVLLYLTASRLFGRNAAVVAAALWAVSEPVLRLAFATYDPLSVFLTALSAWIILQARDRKYRGELVAAAAVILAIANLTAYSGIVIDPVVIAFAIAAWQGSMGIRRAVFCGMWFTATAAAALLLLITATHCWSAIITTIFSRNAQTLGQTSDLTTVPHVISNAWAYVGLTAILATIGLVIAIYTAYQRSLLIVLGVALTIVPIAQAHDQVTVSMDKHLAFGLWFGAMAAGYGCAAVLRTIPAVKTQAAVIICAAIAFVYPSVNGWNAAQHVYQSWPNNSAFLKAIYPLIQHHEGPFYTSGGDIFVESYYTSRGANWSQWNILPLTAPYGSSLRKANYQVISVFYVTAISSPGLSSEMLLAPDSGSVGEKLLDTVGENERNPGVGALTIALENDHSYQLVATGPNDSNKANGIFAIWVHT